MLQGSGVSQLEDSPGWQSLQRHIQAIHSGCAFEEQFSFNTVEGAELTDGSPKGKVDGKRQRSCEPPTPESIASDLDPMRRVRPRLEVNDSRNKLYVWPLPLGGSDRC
jgi:hypothetical protein